MYQVQTQTQPQQHANLYAPSPESSTRRRLPDPQPSHSRTMPAPHQPQQTQAQQPRQERERVTVLGIPAMGMPDDFESRSTRSYTPVKVVGDGSFGTVLLCDWHSPLPPNTPLSPMQRGAGARPDFAGKRLVAIKRMRRRWEGGWEECRQLKELESLRVISSHPNIIPLYDYFILPSTKELHFVFECMEGNLYQLIKSRKGRPLAGGLVSSIFRQVVQGLHHVHSSGYFHRDMKPENLLVTTTGLHNYTTTNPQAVPGQAAERDVAVIVKLADFGLAREINSQPPYTEYVSTRWYRAPEVLLRSRDYSTPVDMWALGTIMAELVNLRPLFPGQTEPDQVALICEVLGDPCDDYGKDERGVPLGGGPWSRGIRIATHLGYAFPKSAPKNFPSLFEPNVPKALIECISDLLKYDPAKRLTSYQCLHHQYLVETTPIGLLSTETIQPSNTTRSTNGTVELPAATPRTVPPSHSHPNDPSPNNLSIHPTPSQYPDFAVSPLSSNSLSPMSPYGGLPQTSTTNGLTEQLRELDLPIDDLSVYSHRPGEAYRQHQPQYSDIEMHDDGPGRHPSESSKEDLAHQTPVASSSNSQQAGHSSGKSLFGGFKKNKHWNIFGGGGDHHKAPTLPPVEEVVMPHSTSTLSLKRSPSASTSGSREQASNAQQQRNVAQQPTPGVVVTPAALSSNEAVAVDPKKAKREADRLTKEAAKQRRAEEEAAYRARSRTVLNKRTLLQTAGEQIEWRHGASIASGQIPPDKGKERARPPPSAFNRRILPGGSTRGVEQSDSFKNLLPGIIPEGVVPSDDYHGMVRDGGRMSKARKREGDDDHSMSSVDMRSDRRQSLNSIATVDSDPGPTRPPQHRALRERGSAANFHRPPSHNSLRSALSTGHSSVQGYTSSVRSSTSLEQGFLTDFASMSGPSRRVASPSDMHPPRASLSPHFHPSPYPSHPTHTTGHSTPRSPDSESHLVHNITPMLQQSRSLTSAQYITLPPIGSLGGTTPETTTAYPVLLDKSSHETLYAPSGVRGEYLDDNPPGSPMHPMFQVPRPSHPPEDVHLTHHPPNENNKVSLPPFSHFASIAGQGVGS